MHNYYFISLLNILLLEMNWFVSIKHVETMFFNSLFCPIYSIDVLIIIFSAPDQVPDGSMIGGGRKLKPLKGNAIGLNMTRFVLLDFYKFV